LDSHRQRPHRAKPRELVASDEQDRAATAAVRAEVVDILAGAIFTMILDGHLPPPRAEQPKQIGDCS
jgi:hypothetical protein